MRTAKTAVLLLAVAAFGAPAIAQEQQAGNEASTNAEETFQALIEQCDDTDALILRARVRLVIGRTTPEAAAAAQQLLDEGLAACGQGDMTTAMAKLEESLQVADSGATELFGQDATTETAGADEAAEAETASEDGAAEETPAKPWWQFW